MKTNNIPPWVKWEGEVIIERIAKKIIEEYKTQEYFFDCVSYEPFVKNMSYEDIRDAVTYIDTYDYNNPAAHDYDSKDYLKYYDKVKLARENFNKWFDEHLSANMLSLYNFYDDTYNTEKWSGERRYALLTRTNHKGYTEMSCLKAAVRFQHLQDEDPQLLTSINSARMLSKYLKTPYWGFGEEAHTYEYDYEKSKEEFDICNRMRKREIVKQNEFIDAIFLHKDIDKAYAIMPNEDKIDY